MANFKGGVGKTSMAAHLAMSAALDGYRVLVIDLDSQGSMTSIFGGAVAERMGHGLPADRARLCARAAGREPAPGRARRRAAAARGHAGRGAEALDRRRGPEDPLAEHRPDRRAAEPLLGRVPDPGLAHGAARLEALGGAVERARPRRHPRRLRHRHARYPAGARLPHHQRPDRRRHPAGAARRLLPRVRFDRALLRHAAFDLRLDRGRREHRGARARPRRDPLRMGRGARHRHPLRRRPAGRARRADAGLSRAHPQRPGGRSSPRWSARPASR